MPFLPEEELREERKFLLVMNLSSQLNCSVLTNKNEISVVLKNGLKVKSDLGTLYFYNFKSTKSRKVAFFIRKSSGKAFYRNYLKRIIRFYLRSNVTLLNNYNRVIFFYNYRKKIKYTFLKQHMDAAVVEAYQKS